MPKPPSSAVPDSRVPEPLLPPPDSVQSYRVADAGVGATTHTASAIATTDSPSWDGGWHTLLNSVCVLAIYSEKVPNLSQPLYQKMYYSVFRVQGIPVVISGLHNRNRRGAERRPVGPAG